MSDHETTLSEADVLRELEAVAPLVSDAFAHAGGPSGRVLDAIRAEARKAAAERRRSLRLHAVFRRAAAAAVLTLLLTGSFRTYLQHSRHAAHEQAVTLLLISAATEDGAGYASLADAADDLAQFLLTMQGLDQDTFFTALDETELL